MLWQPPPPSPATGPGTVTYYIDRVPTAIFAATAHDAFYYPEINLQVFHHDVYDGGPPYPSAAHMNLTYYRWYQTNGNSIGCSSAPQLPVVASPNPSPSPASTAIGVAHSGTVFINSSGTSPSDVMPTLPSAPAPNNMLIMIASSVAGLGGPVPTGWTFINSSSYLNIAYCIVGTGSGQCPAQNSYDFGSGQAIAKLFEISGANTTVAPSIAVDKAANDGNPNLQRTLAIPNSGGLTFDAAGIYSMYGGTIVSVTDALAGGPPTYDGQTEVNNTNALNKGMMSLVINKMTKETFQAPFPFKVAMSVLESASPPPQVTVNAQIISILPAGATAVPVPSPSHPPAAVASVKIVQTAALDAGTTQSNVGAITFAATPSPGDVILAYPGGGASAAQPTPPSSWTTPLPIINSGGAMNTHLEGQALVQPTSGGVASFTFQKTTGNYIRSINAVDLVGAAPTALPTASATTGVQGSGADTATSAAVTATLSGSIIIAVFQDYAGSSTPGYAAPTAPPNWTFLQATNPANGSQAMFYSEPVGGSATTLTLALSAASANDGWVLSMQVIAPPASMSMLTDPVSRAFAQRTPAGSNGSSADATMPLQ